MTVSVASSSRSIPAIARAATASAPVSAVRRALENAAVSATATGEHRGQVDHLRRPAVNHRNGDDQRERHGVQRRPAVPNSKVVRVHGCLAPPCGPALRFQRILPSVPQVVCQRTQELC